MRWQGVVRRVTYTNIGVEADDMTAARSKLLSMAEALPPDLFDYMTETAVYMREFDEKGRGRLVSISVDRSEDDSAKG